MKGNWAVWASFCLVTLALGVSAANGKPSESVVGAAFQTTYAGGSGTADRWSVFHHDPGHIGYSTSSAPETDTTIIATKADLLAMAANTANYAKCFILTADIDMGGQVFTTAIIAASTGYGFNGTAFAGTFNGNGHRITHFAINGGNNYYLGLFGYIGSGGSVNNLGLENFTVSGAFGFYYVGGLAGYNCGSIGNCYSTGAVSGYEYVGGLVGHNPSGSISDCYSTGTVNGGYDSGGLVGVNGGSVSYCYSTVAFSGVAYIGGLVGYNSSGNIDHSYSTGTVSGYQDVGGLVGYHPGGSISNCYSTGAVSSTGSFAGGLAGENYGTINNCYSRGAVSGHDSVGGLAGASGYTGSISDCYSTGSVSGSSYVGGLVGQKVPGGGAVSSFWDTQTSGQTYSPDGIGKTTAEMKTESTFTDAEWDFVTVWGIVQGETYPFFIWPRAGVDQPLPVHEPAATLLAILSLAPNPFSASLEVYLQSGVSGAVTMEVYDVSGKVVGSTLLGDLGPGLHRVRWDGRDRSGASVSSGVYFVRLRGTAVESRAVRVVRLR